MQKRFDEIIKADPDIEDYPFGIQMKKFLSQAKTDVDKACAENESVAKKFDEANNWYMITKQDPMREKSDEFFKFWNTIIDAVVKSMPKIEAPKKAKKEGTAAAKGRANP